MSQDILEVFSGQLTEKLGEKFTLRWEVDKRGVVCGWCKITDPEDITIVAELVASYKGRIMTISPLNTSNENDRGHVIINYHFYFEKVNLTVAFSLQEDKRQVNSITPILKSADWHEREMQELYNIKLIGHPNPQRLFLDSSIDWTDTTMIPLSEAMNGNSTNTLWEKVMEAKSKEAGAGE